MFLSMLWEFIIKQQTPFHSGSQVHPELLTSPISLMLSETQPLLYHWASPAYLMFLILILHHGLPERKVKWQHCEWEREE